MRVDSQLLISPRPTLDFLTRTTATASSPQTRRVRPFRPTGSTPFLLRRTTLIRIGTKASR